MLNNNEKGFSLAEALITLTIVSLILAATLPVITKKQNVSDSMWQYVPSGTGANSNIFYGLGDSQATIIGSNAVPGSSYGSRLLIITPADASADTIKRSLVDFYQKTSATTVTQIGRIAFDTHGNSAIGLKSLASNTFSGTQGAFNTAFGSSSLRANTTGRDNTAIGNFALDANQGGNDNVAIGSYSSAFNNGSSNTSVGKSSLYVNTTGGSNVAVGGWSLYNNNSSNNTAVGTNALLSNTSGGNNTALGTNACDNITTNSGNVCIGYMAGPTTNTSNQLFIDNSKTDLPLIWGNFTGGSKAVKINGTLTITGSGFVNGATAITSDSRLKNIGAESKSGLEKILQIKVKNYTLKADKNKRKRNGAIAQELQAFFPEAVIKGPGNDKYKSLFYIDTNEIVYALVNSVKQLYSKIVSLSDKLNLIEQQINEKNTKIIKLEEQMKAKDNSIQKLKNENKIQQEQIKKIELKLKKLGV